MKYTKEEDGLIIKNRGWFPHQKDAEYDDKESLV